MPHSLDSPIFSISNSQDESGDVVSRPNDNAIMSPAVIPDERRRFARARTPQSEAGSLSPEMDSSARSVMRPIPTSGSSSSHRSAVSPQELTQHSSYVRPPPPPPPPPTPPIQSAPPHSVSREDLSTSFFSDHEAEEVRQRRLTPRAIFSPKPAVHPNAARNLLTAAIDVLFPPERQAVRRATQEAWDLDYTQNDEYEDGLGEIPLPPVLPPHLRSGTRLPPPVAPPRSTSLPVLETLRPRSSPPRSASSPQQSLDVRSSLHLAAQPLTRSPLPAAHSQTPSHSRTHSPRPTALPHTLSSPPVAPRTVAQPRSAPLYYTQDDSPPRVAQPPPARSPAPQPRSLSPLPLPTTQPSRSPNPQRPNPLPSSTSSSSVAAAPNGNTLPPKSPSVHASNKRPYSEPPRSSTNERPNLLSPPEPNHRSRSPNPPPPQPAPQPSSSRASRSRPRSPSPSELSTTDLKEERTTEPPSKRRAVAEPVEPVSPVLIPSAGIPASPLRLSTPAPTGNGRLLPPSSRRKPTVVDYKSWLDLL